MPIWFSELTRLKIPLAAACLLLSISQNTPVDSEKQTFQMTFLEIRNTQMIDGFYTNNDKLVYFLVLVI